MYFVMLQNVNQSMLHVVFMQADNFSYKKSCGIHLAIEGVANGLSKQFGSRKILADFHGSRSLVFSAVVCVSESRFFDQRLFLAFCLLLLIAFVVHKRWYLISKTIFRPFPLGVTMAKTF